MEVSQPAPPPDPRPAFWQPKMKEEPLRPQFSSALDMMFFGGMAKLLLMMLLWLLLLMMMMMMMMMFFRKGKHPVVGIGKIEKMGNILVEHTSRVGHFVYNVNTGKPDSPSENVFWEPIDSMLFVSVRTDAPKPSSLTIYHI